MSNKNEYWEERYKNGENSGYGSRGFLRSWKWYKLKQYIDKDDLNDIIDVGCGDLAFMEDHNPNKYTGIDISETIISRNKINHPEWKFYTIDASIYIHGISSKVVFCHDILFHILDDDIYYSILNNLVKYSEKYISVYAWDTNPIPIWNLKAQCFGSRRYQKYRKFDNYINIFNDAGFDMISKNKTDSLDKYGALYIFKKHT